MEKSKASTQKNLSEIVKYIQLSKREIKGNSYNIEKDLYPCDCGCEQGGEGYCMDC